ncbi:MAG: class I poly(R)-hydroxyalkanoic acid synthase [Gammaproteobacteria bacterium]|nr:class I poly(R)-hydroxyalkanoic acid synthase [Gammaproteobacteria bacterium]
MEMNAASRFDAAEWTQLWTTIAGQSQRLTQHYLEHAQDAEHDLARLNQISQAFQRAAFQLFADPAKLMAAQTAFMQEAAELWMNALKAMAGHPVEPVKQADKRFAAPEWQSAAVFEFIKSAYLLFSEHLQELMGDVQGLPHKDQEKLRFYTRQFVNALSPSNFAATNPAVIKETVETGGLNLMRGLSNMLDDLERNRGKLNIKMTDLEAFKPGENVAATPGSVVFQNDLIQLIQYAPSTEKVHKRPILILPPWINKFYILDLRAKNSLVKWLVDQGHTVFLCSWVNPQLKHKDKGFEDYMLEGPLAALTAIEQATGEKEVNALGYCLGGTLLAATAAYCAAKKDKRIASATFLASLIDFSNPGEIGVFIDEAQLAALDKQMAAKGVFSGRTMAASFNMLRENDLVWSYYVNNYLMGKEPMPFDLLYWNCDVTNLPAKMHAFYLRKMYLENVFKEPGGISLNGTAIDVRKIKVPAYFLSTDQDHIALWQSTYDGAKLFAGDTRFVLGGSGHIAGVINPADSTKYGYRVNDALPDSAEAWAEAATANEGSWWKDWGPWLAKLSGAKVAARQPGSGNLPVIEPAPGSYVLGKAE